MIDKYNAGLSFEQEPFNKGQVAPGAYYFYEIGETSNPTLLGEKGGNRYLGGIGLGLDYIADASDLATHRPITIAEYEGIPSVSSFLVEKELDKARDDIKDWQTVNGLEEELAGFKNAAFDELGARDKDEDVLYGGLAVIRHDDNIRTGFFVSRALLTEMKFRAEEFNSQYGGIGRKPEYIQNLLRLLNDRNQEQLQCNVIRMAHAQIGEAVLKTEIGVSGKSLKVVATNTAEQDIPSNEDADLTREQLAIQPRLTVAEPAVAQV
jgi:hypothetical protein